MSHRYCTECGFQNTETANYCSRCGAFIAPGQDENTLSLGPGETDMAGESGGAGSRGPALVVRSGGGRAGETFERIGARTLIGRSPECDVFLDDVTVSRRHAEILVTEDGVTIRDLGSLNGTFVNRHRIDEAPLEDDDEVQVGKYRLTFLQP